jgi:hypothetical protein
VEKGLMLNEQVEPEAEGSKRCGAKVRRAGKQDSGFRIQGRE